MEAARWSLVVRVVLLCCWCLRVIAVHSTTQQQRRHSRQHIAGCVVVVRPHWRSQETLLTTTTKRRRSSKSSFLQAEREGVSSVSSRAILCDIYIFDDCRLPINFHRHHNHTIQRIHTNGSTTRAQVFSQSDDDDIIHICC